MSQLDPQRRRSRTSDTPAHWYHDLLTAEEEIALARRAKQGDQAARDELILKNQRLIVSIAKHHVGGFHDLDDLVSAGNRGLIRAVEKFDPERGIRFSTYATRWVRCFVIREITSRGYAVPVPEYALRLANRYLQAVKELTVAGEYPTFEQAYAASGLDPRVKEHVQCACLVLDMECESMGNEIEAPTPHSGATDEQKDHAAWFLRQITPRQADIVRRHYGFGGSPVTLADIARHDGINPEGARRLLAKALFTLRETAKREGVRATG